MIIKLFSFFYFFVIFVTLFCFILLSNFYCKNLKKCYIINYNNCKKIESKKDKELEKLSGNVIAV